MVRPLARDSFSCSSTVVYSIPFCKATYAHGLDKSVSDRGKHTVFDTWITGPSAMGSENGTPNSMISAPPACIASIRGTVSSLPGYPAVMKVRKAGTFCFRSLEILYGRGIATHLRFSSFKCSFQSFHDLRPKKNYMWDESKKSCALQR